MDIQGQVQKSRAMTGLWEMGAAMCAALACFDFFGSVLYQVGNPGDKIERPVGEAKVELKIKFGHQKIQFYCNVSK